MRVGTSPYLPSNCPAWATRAGTHGWSSLLYAGKQRCVRKRAERHINAKQRRPLLPAARGLATSFPFWHRPSCPTSRTCALYPAASAPCTRPSDNSGLASEVGAPGDVTSTTQDGGRRRTGCCRRYLLRCRRRRRPVVKCGRAAPSEQVRVCAGVAAATLPPTAAPAAPCRACSSATMLDVTQRPCPGVRRHAG